jgi:hypothetical protein
MDIGWGREAVVSVPGVVKDRGRIAVVISIVMPIDVAIPIGRRARRREGQSCPAENDTSHHRTLLVMTPCVPINEDGL